MNSELHVEELTEVTEVRCNHVMGVTAGDFVASREVERGRQFSVFIGHVSSYRAIVHCGVDNAAYPTYKGKGGEAVKSHPWLVGAFFLQGSEPKFQVSKCQMLENKGSLVLDLTTFPLFPQNTEMIPKFRMGVDLGLAVNTPVGR